MSVPVICCKCGLEWEKPGELEGGGVSHGICEPCLERHYPNTSACSTRVGDEANREEAA